MSRPTLAIACAQQGAGDALAQALPFPGALRKPGLVVVQQLAVNALHTKRGRHNFREFGEPIDHAPEGCVQLGGEIYQVILLHAREIDGRRLPDRIAIAYPAHALGPTYQREVDVFLQVSPAKFGRRTALTCIATNHGNFDAKDKCITELSYLHPDFRLCP